MATETATGAATAPTDLMRHLPNAVTLLRIALGLAIFPLIVWPGGPQWTAATVLFVLAALSDRFDGWLARRLGAVSQLGTVLDPLADKVVILSAALGLVAAQVIDGLAGIAVLAILSREVLVTGFRDMAARRGASLPVTRAAKWKTALQMLSFGVLMGAEAIAFAPLTLTGHVLLWAAAVLTVWTGIDYARRLGAAPIPTTGDRTR